MYNNNKVNNFWIGNLFRKDNQVKRLKEYNSSLNRALKLVRIFFYNNLNFITERFFFKEGHFMH